MSNGCPRLDICERYGIETVACAARLTYPGGSTIRRPKDRAVSPHGCPRIDIRERYSSEQVAGWQGVLPEPVTVLWKLGGWRWAHWIIGAGIDQQS